MTISCFKQITQASPVGKGDKGWPVLAEPGYEKDTASWYQCQGDSFEPWSPGNRKIRYISDFTWNTFVFKNAGQLGAVAKEKTIFSQGTRQGTDSLSSWMQLSFLFLKGSFASKQKLLEGKIMFPCPLKEVLQVSSLWAFLESSFPCTVSIGN